MDSVLKDIARRHGWSIVDGVMTAPTPKPLAKKPLSEAQKRTLLSALKRHSGAYETSDARAAFKLASLGLMTHEGPAWLLRIGASFRLTETGLTVAKRLAEQPKERDNAATS